MAINTDTRIALCYHSPYRGDGVARMKLILARSLADRGFQVDYVGWRTEGTLASRFPSNVRVVKLCAPNILFRLLGLVRYLKHARPAAILSSEDIENLCTVARNIARVQTRVIAIAHIPYSYEFQYRRAKVRLLGPFLVRKVLSKADTIVAVSQGVADDLSTLTEPESNIVTIHNPIDSNEVQALGSQPLDHPWFAPGQPPVILGVGRLQQAKDFPTLIRAFQVVRQNSNSRLMILGEGSERAGLECLVENLGLQGEVEMPGFKDNPYAYLSRSAVFVLSSVVEGFGRVLVEALALGIPVVSTDCPSGPSEILERGAFGRLVPVGDADALAAAILETMAEDGRADELRARARDFSVDAPVDRYLEVMGLNNHLAARLSLKESHGTAVPQPESGHVELRSSGSPLRLIPLDRTGVCGARRGTPSQREMDTGRALDRQIGSTKTGDRYADCWIRTGFAFDRHFCNATGHREWSSGESRLEE